MSLLIEYPPPGPEEVLRVNQVGKDLFVLTLTRRNKHDLFSQAIESLDAGREEASLILKNLRSWVPGAAGLFQPRTSGVILDTPFRLICSSPTGIPLDGAPAIRQYLAVSYSWHGSEWRPPGAATPGSAPAAPGGLWPVGARFADAVLGLRGHPREGVWVDQVCIDQADGDEKQRAVACMDVVYRSCRRLAVLLEDVELSRCEAALCARRDVADLRPHVGAEPPAADIPVLVSLFRKVSRARWWGRAWCFHEFVAGEPWSLRRHADAHNTVFVMGLGGEDRTVSVRWLVLQSILSDVLVKVDHGCPGGAARISPLLASLEDRTSPLLDGPGRRPGDMRSSFVARFNSVSGTGCLLPGDKLSVCINLLGLGLAYVRAAEPTADEVYYLAVMLSLAAGEKTALSFASDEPLVLGGEQSWLMRPATAGDTTLRRFALGDLCGIHSISPARIELDLLIFNHPFAAATDEELAGTYKIFPGEIRSTPPPLRYAWEGAAHRYRPDGELERPRRQFLAAVACGGRGLAARLWAQIERDVVRYSYNTGMFADFEANQDLRPSAEEFTKLLDANSSGSGVGADQDEFTGEDALALLTWVTDPRSMYWISWRTLRGPCSRGGESVLLSMFSSTKNFNFVDPGMAPAAVTIAVPTDLLEADCSLTRAWVLMRVDGEGPEVAWKVMAKCLLLGNTDLAKEVERAENDKKSPAAVDLRTRQVVLG